MALTILTGASPDIKDINKAASLTKGGVRLPNLAKAMRNSGVPQAGHRLRVSVQELEKTGKGNKPAIVHMDLDRGQHGAVVDGFATRGGKKFVAVLDPAGETANKSGETSQLVDKI